MCLKCFNIFLQLLGIDHLWAIALRAQNTDVSLTAINCVNHHYIYCEYYVAPFRRLSLSHVSLSLAFCT